MKESEKSDRFPAGQEDEFAAWNCWEQNVCLLLNIFLVKLYWIYFAIFYVYFPYLKLPSFWYCTAHLCSPDAFNYYKSINNGGRILLQGQQWLEVYVDLSFAFRLELLFPREVPLFRLRQSCLAVPDTEYDSYVILVTDYGLSPASFITNLLNPWLTSPLYYDQHWWNMLDLSFPGVDVRSPGNVIGMRERVWEEVARSFEVSDIQLHV